MPTGGGFGGSLAEAALEVWVDCKPQGYVIDDTSLEQAMPLIASHIHNRSSTSKNKELTELTQLLEPSAGKPPLFFQMLRAQNGLIHFLYFWKAFSYAARLVDDLQEEGLAAELGTMRDQLLRRLEEDTKSKSADESGVTPDVWLLPTSALVEEVHRAASMSGCPRFWQDAVGTLTGTLESSELRIEELTCILLSWLHEAEIWDAGQQPTPGNPPLRSSKSSGSLESEGLPVFVHIYDVSQEEVIQKINRVLAHKKSPLKLGGVFHAGVEVNGLEWSYGGTDSETRPGVSCVEPRTHPQHHYRQTVSLRRTKVPPEDIADIISQMLEDWPGDDYDLLRRNCCHFADDFCRRLGVGGIPGWVDRLARLGATLDTMYQRHRGDRKSVV